MSIIQIQFFDAPHLEDFLQAVRSLLANEEHYEKSDDRYIACQFLLDAGIDEVDLTTLQISIPASTPIENLFTLFNGVGSVHFRFPDSMLDVDGWSEICSISYEQDGMTDFIEYRTAMQDPRFSYIPRLFPVSN